MSLIFIMGNLDRRSTDPSVLLEVHDHTVGIALRDQVTALGINEKQLSCGEYRLTVNHVNEKP
jgi:hypothetical protein